MFHLRRAASRALSQSVVLRQPSHYQANCVSRKTFTQPLIARAFHQSRIWNLAEDVKADADKAAAPVVESASSEEIATPESSSKSQDDVNGESSASSADANSASSQDQDVSRTATETAQDAAAAVASTAQGAAQYARQALQAGVDTVVGDQPAEFPPSKPSALRMRGSTPLSPPPSRILYVGNLFFEVSAPQLEAEFGKYGDVVNSRVVTDPQGTSKGFGFIEFATQEQADRALQELNQKSFQGRRMAVNYHIKKDDRSARQRPTARIGIERPPQQPSKTLFIGNMSYQMSDRDLSDLFREIQNVLDVRVAIDRRSGQPRGFAHADFIDVASAEKAKELLEKKVVYGRPLRVDFTAHNARSSPVEKE